MQKTLNRFPKDQRKAMNLEWHFECLLASFADIVSRAHAGTKPFFRKEWLNATPDEIEALKAK